MSLTVTLYGSQYGNFEKRLPKNSNILVLHKHSKKVNERGLGWSTVEVTIELRGIPNILGRLYKDGLYFETGPIPQYALSMPCNCSICGREDLPHVTLMLSDSTEIPNDYKNISFNCNRCFPLEQISIIEQYFSLCLFLLQIQHSPIPAPDFVSTNMFIAYAVEHLEVEAWKGAKEENPSYKEILKNYVENRVQLSSEHFYVAATIKEWIITTNFDATDEYLAAAYSTFQRELLFIWEVPFVASVVHSYLQSRKSTDSKHVGRPGERLQLTNLELWSQRLIETFRGITFLYKFVDEAGNKYSWFTTKHLEMGKFYEGKATVKEHKIYQGEKETQLTRCIFTVVDNPPPKS